MASLHDERGMVGKLAILWLLLAAVIVMGAIDAGSIVLTRVHLSNIATEAAGDAVSAYRGNHDAAGACQVAATTIHAQDNSLKIGKAFCNVDPATGAVTIRLHKEATTILAGRVTFTKHYAAVTDSETSRPDTL
jgi:uncharacterized membrane protein